MTSLGRVSVRLSGVVRGTPDGRDASTINAPKPVDARAELDRVARVTGADKVMGVVSDYRRTALAGGPQTTQWRIEVQAWGTAMAIAEAPPAEKSESDEQDAARKARVERDAQQQDAAQKTDDAKNGSVTLADTGGARGPASVASAEARAGVRAAADTAPAIASGLPDVLAPPATAIELTAPSTATTPDPACAPGAGR
jgi:hypothetical protein